MPSYFRESFGVSISGAGLLSVAPWLTMFVLTQGGGILSDSLVRRGLSITHARKIMQITGLLMTGGALLAAPLAQDTDMAVLAMCFAMGGVGVSYSGLLSNHLDIAPRYAGILMGITNTAGTVPGIIGVAVTGWLVDETHAFDAPLMLSAAMAFTGALIWLFFARGETLID
jgi:ACS family sodium-dependent inorganic phosphate cotransporter